MPKKKLPDEPHTTKTPAMTKYRRMKTLQNKVKELAEMCDLKISILVEDGQFHGIKEYYTDPSMMLENLRVRMGHFDVKATCKNTTTDFLKIKSVDLNNMVKRAKGISKNAKTELVDLANQLDSETEEQSDYDQPSDKN